MLVDQMPLVQITVKQTRTNTVCRSVTTNHEETQHKDI
jgi:hypothetical protein